MALTLQLHALLQHLGGWVNGDIRHNIRVWSSRMYSSFPLSWTSFASSRLWTSHLGLIYSISMWMFLTLTFLALPQNAQKHLPLEYLKAYKSVPAICQIRGEKISYSQKYSVIFSTFLKATSITRKMFRITIRGFSYIGVKYGYL